MYMILRWLESDSIVLPITNSNGGVHIFNTLKEADDYANIQYDSDRLRVISIEGVQE